MRSVVITGASAGIGGASAKLLLDPGFRVFGRMAAVLPQRTLDTIIVRRVRLTPQGRV